MTRAQLLVEQVVVLDAILPRLQTVMASIVTTQRIVHAPYALKYLNVRHTNSGDMLQVFSTPYSHFGDL